MDNRVITDDIYIVTELAKEYKKSLDKNVDLTDGQKEKN